MIIKTLTGYVNLDHARHFDIYLNNEDVDEPTVNLVVEYCCECRDLKSCGDFVLANYSENICEVFRDISKYFYMCLKGEGKFCDPSCFRDIKL